MWDWDPGMMMVAGHRGERVSSMENTVPAIKKAIALGVDMIETDVHMTSDGALVLMHDHTVDRTTDGTGRVCDLTLDALRRLNPAVHAGQSATIPTLEEFLALCEDSPNLLLNVELKDYPDVQGESWARESADKVMASLKAHGLLERTIIDCFRGVMLEYIDAQYKSSVRLHGFYPYSVLGDLQREPKSFLYCACLWPSEPQDEPPVGPVGWYDALTRDGVQTWVGTSVKRKEDLWTAHTRGARLVTTDDPTQTLQYLRELGLHA
ncbi:glycerophosphodiester phosphodiesterase family protein [Eubacteriales bacterium OttesenSCG-928-A19]|nr:glycerophosphodiester phosphodiesterase family protein [Eubacteriales bacterium OttesenSCG-928-A19]